MGTINSQDKLNKEVYNSKYSSLLAATSINSSKLLLLLNFSLVLIALSFSLADLAVAAGYDLNRVKEEMIDKSWQFVDSATPVISVTGGLVGAFMARNMDWVSRAMGFGIGTVLFGIATQGVKAYYGI